MFKKQVFHIIGLILIVLSFSMLLSSFWSIYYDLYLNQDDDLNAFIYSIAITFLSGLVFMLISRSNKKREISNREGFAIVTIGWIMIAFYSSLPFFFYNECFTITNAFFESMSGLTTTGASILGHASTINVEELPHGILFWRSFTHFIGGMGIIVLSIAILPLLGMGGVQLFRAEVAGPIADKMTPRVKQTAKLLWTIYVGFVCIETLILFLEGMTLHSALCHSFATMATGGFSINNDSILSYGPLIQWTLIFFMFCAATNFSLHYLFLIKGSREYGKDSEFKIYLCLIVFVTLIFFFNIINLEKYSFNLDSIRHAMFTSVSLITTTGFGTENFESWPSLSKTLIFFLLFIGGCAGSTTGGMKIIRTILIGKYLISEVRKMLHPKGVFPIRISGNVIPDDVVKTTLGFYLFYLFIFVFSSLLFSILGLDLETSLSASASAIGNIGPGLGSIGPYENWGHFPDIAKWIASFCMLLGRLEIFTVMVLFSRTFWKR